MRHRDGQFFFSYVDTSSFVHKSIGAAANNSWHLCIMERDGITLRAYLDNGTVVNCDNHSSALAWTTTTVAAGKVNASGVVLDFSGGSGAGIGDVDIGCMVGWANKALSSDERTAIWNSGVPNFGKMLNVHTADTDPGLSDGTRLFYAYDFNDTTPPVGAALSLNGSSLPFTVDHDIWGTGFTLDVADVLALNPVEVWDFQESSGDAVGLVEGYTLVQAGSTMPRICRGGAFGAARRGRYFSRAANKGGLKVTDLNGPLLNRGGDTDSSHVTVVAICRVLSHETQKFVAGKWRETSPGYRQYGMFVGVGFNANSRAMLHISPQELAGGPDPGETYSYDFSASGQRLTEDAAAHILATVYDGETARSYVDGAFQAYTYYGPLGPGNTGSQNPYTPQESFRGGLSEVATDFTVGTNEVGGSLASQFEGPIYGLAVFDRVLTVRELAELSGVSSPTITIDTPNGTYEFHSTIDFDATVVTGGYSGITTTWYSNIDGVLGTGTSISTVLSPGTHTITAISTSTAGVLDTDAITIEVLNSSSSSSDSASAVSSSSSSAAPAEEPEPEPEVSVPNIPRRVARTPVFDTSVTVAETAASSIVLGQEIPSPKVSVHQDFS